MAQNKTISKITSIPHFVGQYFHFLYAAHIYRNSSILSASKIFLLLVILLSTSEAFGQGWATWSITSLNNATMTAGQVTASVTVSNKVNTSANSGFISTGYSGTNFPGTWYTPAPTDVNTQFMFMEIDNNSSASTGSYRVTYTFNRPVTNPLLHFANVDAGQVVFSGTQTSGAAVSITKVSGNTELEVTGTTVNSTPRTARLAGCEALDGTNDQGGCGTVRLNGTYSTVTYTITDTVTALLDGDGHAVSVFIPADFGDAPATYGSAAHNYDGVLRLGAAPDLENANQPSANAALDDTTNTGSADDEDAIASFPNLNLSSSTYSVNVTVTNTAGANATLVGWIDFNRNGTFEAAEGATATVANGTAGGTATLTWSSVNTLMTNGIGNTFARFRMSSATSLTTSSMSGNAANGEVEDYQLSILPSITLNKTSNGGTGSFAFSVTNADTDLVTAGNQSAASIATSTAGTAAAFDADTGTAGTQLIKVNSIADVVVTETVPSGWTLTSGSCTNGTTTWNLSGSAVTILGTNLTAGTGNITCNFTNTKTNPSLSITKSSNGPWVIGQSGAQYSLVATNAGIAATSGVITVADELPTGITANWIGTRSVTSNGITWGCTFSSQTVVCTTSNSIAISGTSTITLPVNVTSTAPIGTNSIKNYAAVGGGGDPFNGGTVPLPGASCTDAAHCTSNQTTINNTPPVANDVTASVIQSTSGQTSILPLNATDLDGTIVSYRIETLPPVASGTLYLCNPGCSAVSAGQVIAAADAGKLKFDPTLGFTGNATFTYTAIDNLGAEDATDATYTIPVAYTINCSNVYASAFSAGRRILYELNGATMTPVFTAPQTLGGLAVSSNGNAYYDNGTFANPPLYSFNGTSQTNTGLTEPNLLVGEAADSAGNVYYIDSAYHLRKAVAGAAGAATDLGALIFDAGDTIGPSLQSGDMTFDANGRLFWYSSIAGTGASYLYFVDPVTRKAKNSGHVGPNGATGAAFDANGHLVTTANSGADVYTINLSSSSLAGTFVGTASPTVYDLGSCGGPNLNPNLAAVKSVANITTSQNPGTLASANDILEYTITVTNSGNMPSIDAALQDSIPSGTTYVAGSTTMNGVAVADTSGAMPFTTAIEINNTTQPSGVILVGAANAVVVKFRVRVNTSGLPASIPNTAAITFPTVSGGTTTTNSVNSNTVSVSTAPPNIVLNKTCPSPSDCTSAAQLPGTDLTYKIDFVNNGGRGATNIVLVDAIPANTDYKVGSATANPATTGLTFTIAYSNNYDPLFPLLATWTYVPVSAGGGAPAGYDRNVKAIRWTASGTLSQTAPNNAGDIGFVTKIR